MPYKRSPRILFVGNSIDVLEALDRHLSQLVQGQFEAKLLFCGDESLVDAVNFNSVVSTTTVAEHDAWADLLIYLPAEGLPDSLDLVSLTPCKSWDLTAVVKDHDELSNYIASKIKGMLGGISMIE
jgi:hypothetical protein